MSSPHHTMTEPDVPTMPEHESGQFMQPDYSQPLMTFSIETHHWTHLAPARFGPGRPCGHNRNVNWTGAAFRYDLFHDNKKRWYGLRWSHGGGTGWLIEKDQTASGVQSLLPHVASLPDEAMRWDFCHQLAESLARTAHAAAYHERHRWEQGVLKKTIAISRQNGQRHARILSPIELAERRRA